MKKGIVILSLSLVVLIGLIVIYIILYAIENNKYLKEKENSLIGTFILDLDRTNLGIYSDSADIYKNLTIEFKPDKTFKLNMSVPFIADTSGIWEVGGMDRWNYIYFDNIIAKYGKKHGTPISNGYLDKGDSIMRINSVRVRADQVRKSDVHVVYFRKLSSAVQKSNGVMKQKR